MSFKSASTGMKIWAISATALSAGAVATAVAVPMSMKNNQQKEEQVEKFTITFESNGGSNVKSQEVEKNKTGIQPVSPTRTGYEFVNWYTDAELTQVFNWSNTITSDIKLYAKWNNVTAVTSCKVKFDIGSGAELIGGSLNRTITKGTPFSQINCPSFYLPSGKKFVRWNCNDSFIIEDTEKETVISAVYADLAADEVANHRLNFVIDGTEHLEYGELHLDVAKGATWPQVLANAKFPVISNTGFIENDFRMPPLDGSLDITYYDQNYVFDANKAAYLTANVNWIEKDKDTNYTRIVYAIADADKDKGEIISGYRTKEIKVGTKFKDIAKPTISGYTGWMPAGTWSIDDDTEINEYTVATPVFKEAIEGEYNHTIILNAGNLGDFPTTGSKTLTITKTASTDVVKFSDFATEIAKIENIPVPTDPDTYEFWGWGLGNDDVVPVGTTQLVAEYNNVSKCYVIFGTGDDVSITGSQAFAITKGTTWADFKTKYSSSFPTVAKAGGWEFDKWVHYDGSTISDSEKINEHWLLLPTFTDNNVYVTVNLNIDSTKATASSKTLTVLKNSKWSAALNSAGFAPNSNYILKNWTNQDGKVMSADDKISGDMTITANLDNIETNCVNVSVIADTTLTYNVYAGTYSHSQYVNHIWYSTDTIDWTELTGSGTLTFTAGTNVYFKGNNNGHPLEYSYLKFTDGEVTLNGSIMGLLDYETIVTTVKASCQFKEFFKDSTAITYVSDDFLPATNTKYSTYQGLFQGCTNLKYATLNLKADNLDQYAYYQMFYDCTSLLIGPRIYAKNLGDHSCWDMFLNCSKLRYVPIFKPETVARGSCRSMFSSCLDLIQAPELPAKTLAADCYRGMFYCCFDLTTLPDLPAETAAAQCYYGMFQRCTSVTTAPNIALKSLNTSCCYQMFIECSGLKNLPQFDLSELSSSTSTGNSFGQTFQSCSGATIERVTIGETPTTEGAIKFITWPADQTIQTNAFKNCVKVGGCTDDLEPGYDYYYIPA